LTECFTGQALHCQLKRIAVAAVLPKVCICCKKELSAELGQLLIRTYFVQPFRGQRTSEASLRRLFAQRESIAVQRHFKKRGPAAGEQGCILEKKVNVQYPRIFGDFRVVSCQESQCCPFIPGMGVPDSTKQHPFRIRRGEVCGSTDTGCIP